MFSQGSTISSSKPLLFHPTLTFAQGKGSQSSSSNNTFKRTVNDSDFNTSVKQPSLTRQNESLLSRSFGGSASDFESLRRQTSDVLAGVTHSGYLLKRSNNPIARPQSDEASFDNEVGPTSAPIRIGSSPPSPPKTRHIIRSKTLTREITPLYNQSHNHNHYSSIGSKTTDPYYENHHYRQVPNNNHVDNASSHVADTSHSRLANSIIRSDSTLSSDCYEEKNISAAFELAAAFFGDDDGTNEETPSPLTNASDRANEAVFTKMSIPSVNHDIYAKISSPSMLVPPPNDSITHKRISSPYYRSESAPKCSTDYQTTDTSQNHPPDVIDIDNHIWRSKYCVLENGVLYFYRNYNDGNSYEAQQEREREAQQHDTCDHLTSQHSDHALHTNYNENDISRSPMPRNPNFLAMMNKPTKNETTNPSNIESVPIWEKRVSLEKVGVVKTAQFEYGDFSLLLVATDCDDNPNLLGKKEVNSTPANTDRLILRASNTDEMNDWLFQFHRALLPFMKKYVNMAGSNGTRAGKRRENMYRKNRVIDTHQYNNTTMPIPMTSNIPPLAPSKNKAFSPDSSTALSLSHGHGRTGFHRRRVQEKPVDSKNSPGSTPGSGSSPIMFQGFKQGKTDSNSLFSQSPSSNLNEEYDSIEENKKHLKPFQLSQLLSPEDNLSRLNSQGKSMGLLEPKEKSMMKDRVTLDKTKDVNSQASPLSKNLGTKKDFIKKDISPSVGGKYVPPHLRKKSAKYVPPHLRNKEKLRKNEKKSDEVNQNIGTNGIKTLSKEFGDKKDCGKINSSQLGGCADPTIVVGSVMDAMHKSRKGPKVGKVDSHAYGYDTKNDPSRCVSVIHESKKISKTNLFWEVGAISECGIRDSNEDSYLIINDLTSVLQSCSENLDGTSSEDFPKTVKDKLDLLFPNINTFGLFAIFDGHLGNQAARFAAEKLPYFITKAICLFVPNQSLSATLMMEKILTAALIELDNSFCRLCVEDGRDWECGATVLVGIVMDASIIVAHLGDSSGVICGAKKNKLIESNKDFVGKSQQQNILRQSGWSILDPDENDVGADLSSQFDVENNDKSIGMMGQQMSTDVFWKEIVDIHSPAREDEKQRIEDANGWITTETEIPISQLQRMDLFDDDVVDILKRCFSDRFNLDSNAKGSKKGHAEPGRLVHISRICGELAVSRALGDRDFKAASRLPPNKSIYNGEDLISKSWEGPDFLQYADNHNRRFIGDVVSSVPETQIFEIHANGFFDEFLLLACDGLWDVMDADDAVRVTRSLLFDNGWSTKKAAARLAELAIHLGSSDNITVIVIRFRQE